MSTTGTSQSRTWQNSDASDLPANTFGGNTILFTASAIQQQRQPNVSTSRMPSRNSFVGSRYDSRSFIRGNLNPAGFYEKLSHWSPLLDFEIEEQNRKIREMLTTRALGDLIDKGEVIGHLRCQRHDLKPMGRGQKLTVIFSGQQINSESATKMKEGALIDLSTMNSRELEKLIPEKFCTGMLQSNSDNRIVVTVMSFSNGRSFVSGLQQIQNAGQQKLFVLAPAQCQPSLERQRDFCKEQRSQRLTGPGAALVLHAFDANAAPTANMRSLSMTSLFSSSKLLQILRALPRRSSAILIERVRKLNDSQKNALCMALEDERPIVAIQGPPGTGKTTVVEEFVRLCYYGKLRLLICAPSNVAVDNVLERVQDDVKAFRLGVGNDIALAEAYLSTGTAVFFATLTTKQLGRLSNIDVIVVDEAAQATEVSVWHAILQVEAKRLVLTGDIQQLPAVVVSEEAKSGDLGLSLMERLSEKVPALDSSCMLTVHEVEDNFVKATSMSDISLLWVDTSGRFPERQRDRLNAADKSHANDGEAALVAKYLSVLINCFAVKQTDIGVISPYASQTSLIKKLVGRRFPNVMIDTVDSFQGQEKLIIILSMVRSNKSGAIGFLREHRRTNVAVTRAKRHVAIIGDRKTLIKREDATGIFRSLIAHSTVHSVVHFQQYLDQQLAAFASLKRPVKAAAMKSSQREIISAHPTTVAQVQFPAHQQLNNGSSERRAGVQAVSSNSRCSVALSTEGKKADETNVVSFAPLSPPPRPSHCNAVQQRPLLPAPVRVPAAAQPGRENESTPVRPRPTKLTGTSISEAPAAAVVSRKKSGKCVIS